MPIIEPQTIDAWCRRTFGAAVVREIFSSGHLGQVVAVVLDDGRSVVVKVRPPSRRLQAVVAVQRQLHDRGVPCPRPLAGPVLLEGQAITAEIYVPAGPPPTNGPPPEECAALLGAVISAAPPPHAAADLAPAPPWVLWDHPGDATWPEPDDLRVDLNGSGGPDWLDDAGKAVRRRLREDDSAVTVGHVDWEAHNMGWEHEVPVVVYDWDSLAIRSEAAIAGAAATVFGSTTGTTIAATIEQTAAFLDVYMVMRPQWRERDREVAWAAGLWVLLYNAKKECAGAGRGYLDHLERELDQRMDRAGC